MTYYRCNCCGLVFEEGDQAIWHERHGLDSPPYERREGCPHCFGDYEEVVQCDICGDWHTEDTMYDGWCKQCVRESINYDTFFEYCEAHKDERFLDTFIMSYLLGGMDCPKNVSDQFHDLMIQVYQRRVSEIKCDNLFLGKTYRDIIDNCVKFIMDDDGINGIESYVEWIKSRKEVE